MATSGSTDFSVTGGDIVTKAFDKAGVKAQEQSLTAAEMSDGMFSLNVMVKAWQAQRLHLWSKEEGVLFLDAAKTDYLVGPSGDEATTLDDFVSTTTTADEIALATVIEVTSSAGMTAGDKVGIKQDDITRHWTTIATVDSATQITLTTGLVSAATAGNSVFTYTSTIERPLRILGVRNAQFSTDNEFEIRQFSRFEYFNQPNKTSTGTVVNFYYSPQLNDGRFYVWPTASSVDDYIRFTYERSLQDFDETSNNPDFPIEWTETLIWNLAARIAVDYNAPLQKQQTVAVTATSTLQALLGFDEEPSSLNIRPRML